MDRFSAEGEEVKIGRLRIVWEQPRKRSRLEEARWERDVLGRNMPEGPEYAALAARSRKRISELSTEIATLERRTCP